MANPSFLDARKANFNNFCSTIASNFNACASRINQSPAVQKTVATIKTIAPFAITTVGSFYLPAQAKFAALGFGAILVSRKAITQKTLVTLIIGIALSTLLTKSVVATVAAVTLIGIADQYIQAKKAQNAVKIEEEKRLQKILDAKLKNQEVEDTDSDKESIQSLSNDSSLEEPSASEPKLPIANLNDEPSNSGKELPKLNSAESSYEASFANKASENEESADETITQEEKFEEEMQPAPVDEHKFVTSQEATDKIMSNVLAVPFEDALEVEGNAVIAIQVEEVITEKEEEQKEAEIIVSAIVIETTNEEKTQ